MAKYKMMDSTHAQVCCRHECQLTLDSLDFSCSILYYSYVSNDIYCVKHFNLDDVEFICSFFGLKDFQNWPFCA